MNYNQTFSKIFDSTIMKDCPDRLSWKSQREALQFSQWMAQFISIVHSAFLCDRCSRWHIVPKEAVKFVKSRLKRERCVTTRELHLQLCRVSGVSLEELQTRIDLNKINLNGNGVEFITLKPSPKTTHETESGLS